MSENLQHCYRLFKIILEIKNKSARDYLLKNTYCDPVFRALVELARNSQNLPLNREQKRKLKRHRKLLTELVSAENKPIRKKKQLYIQSGGALNILIPALATIISSLINRNA